MIALKRILVPTDFGDASEAALDYGRALARTFGASLAVLHVADNMLATPVGLEGYVVYPEAQLALEESARKRLDALVLDRHEPGATRVLLTSNAPAPAIVSYAREQGIDLIVMGTHGRGGMAHLFMGSVAEEVVRTAPCPVLTVKRPEHEFVMAEAFVEVATA